MIGIVSYGSYVPRYRLKLASIAEAWKKNAREVVGSLGIEEKAVPGIDEDAVTIAIEAGYDALTSSELPASVIEALFVGSESHPYAVNPTSTIVGELLGIGHDYLAADMEFACKAGTAGIQAIAGLIGAGHARFGMAIGADTAQSKPHDALEYTSATAGVALMLGSDTPAAILRAETSYSSDTPDFWRRDGIRYPSHAGRFTGEPAYFTHVLGSSTKLLNMTGLAPDALDYCVFHMPNGKFPRDVAKRLGFTREQVIPSLVVDHIGNPYSASSMLGLAATLDIAKPGQKIFMASYGSGAGSDAFVWEVTERILPLQKKRAAKKTRVIDQIQNKTEITYTDYLKQTHKL